MRVLIADDHPLFCHALRDVLVKQHDLEVIGEAHDGEEAVQLAESLAPDIIVMDISMPKLSGLEAIRQIKSSSPDMYILALTVHSDSEHVLRILQAGADGYLTKNVHTNEVVQAIYALVTGEIVLSREVSKEIFRYAFKHIPKVQAQLNDDSLTAKEMEVLKLIAVGIGNKEIAHRQNVSLRTVKGHLTELFSKLNAATRTEAVIVALRRGILTLEDIS